MADKFEHIFIISCDGIERLKLPYGGEDAALAVLRATVGHKQWVTVVSKEPGYATLKRRWLFIMDNSYGSNKVLTKYVNWVGGVLEGHTWLVTGYTPCDTEIGEHLGVTNVHAKAMKVAGKWDDGDDDEDHYATIQLVPCL